MAPFGELQVCTVVTHLECGLELNGLEAPDELQINNLSQYAKVRTPTEPNQRATTVKKPRHYINQCCLLKNQKEQAESTQNGSGNRNSGTNKYIPNKNNINNNNKNNKIENSNIAERKPKTVYQLCETCGKTNHSTERCHCGANAANWPLPRHKRREEQDQVPQIDNRIHSSENAPAAAQNLQ